MDLAAFAGHFRATFPDLVGARVVVALSGGGDSVALLHLLHGAGLGLELEAAHVHHGARGAEADADAAFAAALARRLGMPFHLLRLPAAGRAPRGREAWWRERRYAALLELGDRLGAAAVATAHTRDDVAEGVLTQLLRGGGPRALAGIAARTPQGVIRPLLPFGREELRRWLRERGLAWREDSSNLDTSHLRNLVRHRILPELERHVPAVRRHLLRLAADLADAEAALAAAARAAVPDLRPWSPVGGVPLAALRALPRAVLARWLQRQAARLGCGPATRAQLAGLERLLAAGAPRAVTLGRRWRLRAAAGRLWAEPPAPPPSFEATLEPGREVALPLPGWRVRVRPGEEGGGPWASPPLPGPALSVRSLRPGDRFAGRPAVELLARFPRHLRAAWPVVCHGGRIVWIPGTSSGSAIEGRWVVEVEHP